MAIRIERSGARTVVVQNRRPVRLAAWGLLAITAAAVAATLVESREVAEAHARDRTRVRCQRPPGRCEVTRGSRRWVMEVDTMDRVTAQADDEGAAPRVMAVITRRHGLPDHHLCEAGAADREADGIRAAAAELSRFVADRRIESVDVSCHTRRPEAAGAGPPAGWLTLELTAALLALAAIFLFLVEVSTEIDREAGVVRIRGRRTLPPRRWSLERPIAEVVAVDVASRGWGSARWFTIHVKFADGRRALLLSPVTGDPHKVDGWVFQLRTALGLTSNQPTS
jgi:hypothetical protein